VVLCTVDVSVTAGAVAVRVVVIVTSDVVTVVYEVAVGTGILR
jgi:hypothetical protein